MYHPELDFEDGNIILRALVPPQNPSDAPFHVSFRVHKSILRMQSEVFDGMMDIPQTPAQDGNEGQIRVVDMSDGAAELIAMLKLIYHPEEILKHPSAQDVFDDLALALPVVRKYQMDKLFRACINRILADCPQTLQEWDLRAETIDVVKKTDGFPWVGHVVVEPAGIIALARSVPEIHSLVPAAFYNLSSADHAVDDTMEIDEDFLAVYAESGGIIVRRSLLTTKDLLIVGRGSNAIKSEIYHTAHNLQSRLKLRQYGIPSDLDHIGCSQPIPGGLEKFISDILIDSIAMPNPDPIAWMRIKADAAYPEGMCRTCLGKGKQFLIGYRKYLWTKLPEFFY
ncbi:hypothetical protein FS837_002928 [Tulasnella sp. UAMH 9824]|nr:hypothetical protein FS837_002928 [Tulasnella sp. UAMH 9824]